MCIFYHASNKSYTNGQNVSINDFEGETTYDYERRSNDGKQVYDLLDEVRPNGVFSRKKCRYLFRELCLCQAYARKGGVNHVYKVKCDDNDVFGPYPMTLVNTLFKCNNEESKAKIINEYWHPTHNWKVHEYLASSFTVIQKMQKGSGMITDGHIDDIQLSRKLYVFN